MKKTTKTQQPTMDDNTSKLIDSPVAEKVEDQLEEQPKVPPQLNIADLQMLANIVDLASQRGAFRAPELSQVGETYNRLTAFLTHIQETQSKTEEQPEKQEESA